GCPSSTSKGICPLRWIPDRPHAGMRRRRMVVFLCPTIQGGPRTANSSVWEHEQSIGALLLVENDLPQRTERGEHLGVRIVGVAAARVRQHEHARPLEA